MLPGNEYLSASNYRCQNCEEGFGKKRGFSDLMLPVWVLENETLAHTSKKDTLYKWNRPVLLLTLYYWFSMFASFLLFIILFFICFLFRCTSTLMLLNLRSTATSRICERLQASGCMYSEYLNRANLNESNDWTLPGLKRWFIWLWELISTKSWKSTQPPTELHFFNTVRPKQ